MGFMEMLDRFFLFGFGFEGFSGELGFFEGSGTVSKLGLVVFREIGGFHWIWLLFIGLRGTINKGS